VSRIKVRSKKDDELVDVDYGTGSNSGLLDHVARRVVVPGWRGVTWVLFLRILTWRIQQFQNFQTDVVSYNDKHQ